MKKVFASMLFLVSINLFSQQVENLNNYKYVIIDYKVYPNGNKDIYQVGNLIYEKLKEYGFIIIIDKDQPKEFTDNPCQALICTWDDSFDKAKGINITMTFTNCKDEIIYKNIEQKTIASNTSNYYQTATETCLKPIKKLKYKFNEATKVDVKFFQIDTGFKTKLKTLGITK